MKITVDHFSKSFGPKQVIKDLSFAVEEGEVFAFLGANGSGKTTTIRCLLDIYQPDSGKLTIDGRTFDYEISKKVGYLPEERGLYATSRVFETLVYFAQLKGMSAQDARNASDSYLEEVGLSALKNVEIKTLSSGQQQKVQLGIATINSPSLLILDEPTKGLDPVNRDLLMQRLMSLNKKGSTIIFISHQMDQVEKVAERLLMIQNGKSLLYGDVESVRKEFGSNTIHLRFNGDLPENDEMYSSKVENRSAELTPVDGVETDEVLKYLLDSNVSIQQFSLEAPSLHEIFVQVSHTDSKHE